MIPPSVIWAYLDASADLGALFARRVDDVERRLATRALVGERGRVDHAEWYRRFQPLRDAILKQGDLFRPPLLAFGRPGDGTGRLLLLSAGKTPDALPMVPDLPAALVGVAADPEGARRWLDTLSRAVTAGLADTAKGPPASDGHLVPVELGLGVPTWELPFDWMDPLTPGAITGAAAARDFRLHVFFLDNLLVLSSSASLSRDIVAASRGTGPRVDLAKFDSLAGGRGLVGLQLASSGLAVELRRVGAHVRELAAPKGTKVRPDAAAVVDRLVGLLGTWRLTKHETRNGRRLTGRLSLARDEAPVARP